MGFAQPVASSEVPGMLGTWDCTARGIIRAHGIIHGARSSGTWDLYSPCHHPKCQECGVFHSPSIPL
ncbi:hypothetical protein DV515_00000594 [Chloebia gouldiae]|uniref:Uncharacterized protein n=1 Tax=Chloebia gouldiae TaxID=44316 RepID=A0A3L8T2V0_CHLGU|nr:hypothetical protein DV515_00000594 [Chloebia gouldiae]